MGQTASRGFALFWNPHPAHARRTLATLAAVAPHAARAGYPALGDAFRALARDVPYDVGCFGFRRQSVAVRTVRVSRRSRMPRTSRTSRAPVESFASFGELTEKTPRVRVALSTRLKYLAGRNSPFSCVEAVRFAPYGPRAKRHVLVSRRFAYSPRKVCNSCAGDLARRLLVGHD